MGGAGMAQWLERRTGDQKVPGSSPRRSGGGIFFPRVNFLCWLLFRYPFHPRVTAVARKKILDILPKMQVAGYSYTHMHPTYVALTEYTELAPRQQQFHVVPAM